MGDSTEGSSRRKYLRGIGVALAGGLTGLLDSSSDDNRAEPDRDTADDSSVAGHYVPVTLGSDVWYNRVNNWSAPLIEQGTGPYQLSQWQRESMVRDKVQSVMEGVYGEAIEEPRKSMRTLSKSLGGAGYIVTDAWAGLEFYTSGTAPRTVTVEALAEYDSGTNRLYILEKTGQGFVGNYLDLAVVDITARTELGRGNMWSHFGVAENYTGINQAHPIVWADTAVNVTLHPGRYYGIYFLGRSVAHSISPIEGAWQFPEATAWQEVGIGHIYLGF